MVDSYIEGLKAMEHRVPLWPPVQEMLYARMKFNVIQNLDWVAMNVTHTAWLLTCILQLPLNTKLVGQVLKWECSDARWHVIVPEDLTFMSLNELNKQLETDGHINC
jgi:hypothetical protein